MYITDLIGLNGTQVSAMPIVDEISLVDMWLKSSPSISLAGSRHSQGGQTVLEACPMLLMECMNQVTYDPLTTFVTAQAGATWNAIHHCLAPHRRSVLVQQSSGHFTIGGSISVNCHGRDPRQGPVSSTIVSMQVMLGDGTVIDSVKPGDDVFKAVVGGYGSCGVILSAVFKTCDNNILQKTSTEMPLADYVQKLFAHVDNQDWPEIHFAWLNFSENQFFKSVLSVDYVSTNATADSELVTNEWVKTEALQQAWAQLRQKTLNKNLVWTAVLKANKSISAIYRTNSLREAVGFISYLDTRSADLLQEYFVPLDNLLEFIERLSQLIVRSKANLLSCTIRVVQKDDSCYLSYCPNEMMVSVVLDINTRLKKGIPLQKTEDWIVDAMIAAKSLRGSYYLPYYKFASKELFQQIYSQHAFQHQAMLKYAGGKMNNSFLERYFYSTP